MTARDIALAITCLGYTQPFNYRRNLVVENVYWGWGLKYEADLIVVSKAGYATEVEIKISKSDLIRDFEKKKYTMARDPRIARYYFAMPQKLVDTALEVLPKHIGIISVRIKEGHTRYRVEVIRRAVRDKKIRPCSEEDIDKLLRLSAIKYWARSMESNPGGAA